MAAPEGGGTQPAGALRLEVLAGKAAGFTIVVDDRMVIGRHSEGPGRLADDPELSRHHAEISRRPGGEFAIEDLSSTNGTFVNGKRIEEPSALSAGDKIDVGATTIVVREAPVLPAPDPAPEAGPPAVDVRAATVTVGVPDEMRAPEPAPVAGPEPFAQPEPVPEPEPVVEPEPEPFVAPEPEPVAGPAAVPEPVAAPGPAVEPLGEPELELALDPLPEPVAVVEPPPTEPLEAEAPPEATTPPLQLRVTVDFARGESVIALDDGDTVRMQFEDGRWRLVPGGS